MLQQLNIRQIQIHSRTQRRPHPQPRKHHQGPRIPNRIKRTIQPMRKTSGPVRTQPRRRLNHTSQPYNHPTQHIKIQHPQLKPSRAHPVHRRRKHTTHLQQTNRRNRKLQTQHRQRNPMPLTRFKHTQHLSTQRRNMPIQLRNRTHSSRIRIKTSSSTPQRTTSHIHTLTIHNQGLQWIDL